MKENKFTTLLDDRFRTTKPRTNGLTIILDIGMGVHGISDLAETSGAHVDFAKIAWGSSLITQNIEEKIKCYRENNIEPMFGGTLFEYAHMRGKVDSLFDIAKEYKIHVEISDGTANVNAKEKLMWVEKFSSVCNVFSEVGGKTAHHQIDWPQAIQDQMNAGAQMVVIEGREVGPVGQEIREDFVDMLR